MFSKPVFCLHDVIIFWIISALITPATIYLLGIDQTLLYFKDVFVGSTSFFSCCLADYVIKWYRK
jgi:hypothetical protein